MPSFTTDAILQKEQSASFTADAIVAARSFTADAWIMGDRWKHHRVRDHFGMESDLYVSLSADVGPYVAFTPVHFVLEDMLARLERLENSNRVRDSFTADGWIAASGTYGLGIIRADAVIKDAGSGSFTADAILVTGGSFTANAIIMPSFTANAYIV